MPETQDILSIGFDYKKTQSDADKVIASLKGVLDYSDKLSSIKDLLGGPAAGFAASKKGADELTKALKEQERITANYNKTLIASAKAQEAEAKATAASEKAKQQLLKTEQEQIKLSSSLEKQAEKTAKALQKEADAAQKQADIPFTSNLNVDGSVIEPAANATGAAISDLERQQADATLTAIEWGNANRKAAEGVNVAKKSAEQLRIEEERDQKIKVEDKLLAAQRTAQLKNQVREENAVKGSLEQRRAALIRLNAVYDNQSPQERASAAGQRLQKVLGGLSTQVKTLEADTGRAQRNVGNYPDSMGKAATATEKFTGAAKKAFSAVKTLANILPGLGISGIFLLAGDAIAGTIKYIQEAISKVVDFAERMRVLGEVNLKAAETYAPQIAKVAGLTSVLNDGNTSLSNKKRALNELIALDPKVLEGLTLTNIATEAGKKILDDYIKSLKARAELEAAVSVEGDAQKEVSKLEVIKDLLRKRLVATKTNYNDLSEEELKFVDKVKTSTGRINFTASLLNLEIPKSDIQQMLVGVDEELKKAGKKVTASLDVFKSKFNASGDKEVKLGIVESLKKQIDDLDKSINTESVESKIPGLVAARKKLQEQLDDLLGKEDKGKKIKTITDYIRELRKELGSIDKQQVTGLLGDTDADLARAKAYQKTLEEIFKLGANEKTPVVRQLLFELSPVSIRLMEDQIKDFNEKTSKDQFLNLLPPPAQTKQFLDEQTKLYEDSINQRQSIASKDFAIEQSKLLANYALGKLTKKQYEQALLDIQEEFAEKSIERQIEEYDASLKYAFIGVANTKENADKRLEIEKKLAEARLALGLKIRLKEDADMERRRQQLIAFLQQVQEGFNQVADLIGGVVNINVTKEKNALQEVEDGRQKNYENEVARISSSQLTEEQKAAALNNLEKQREAQKEKFDRQTREADQKKARFDKQVAIMNIILNTAAAVIKALPNIPLSILAGVLGAAQLAVAIATPIPKYAKGVKNKANAGMGIAGEAGAEVVERPGYPTEIVNRETVMYMPKGTNVTPIGKDQINSVMYRAMAKKTAEAIGAMSNKPDRLEGLVEQLISVTKKGNQKGVVVKNYIKDSREWSIYKSNYYK